MSLDLRDLCVTFSLLLLLLLFPQDPTMGKKGGRR
jgi:hypothetical protein